MTLPTKNQVILLVVALAVAFAFGRYSVSQTPTVSVTADTKSLDKKQTAQDTHTVTKTTETVAPSGAKTIDVTTTTDTVTKVVDTDKQEDKTNSVTTPSKQSKWNVAVIGGIDATNIAKGLTYGASVNKEVIGPVTAGVYGLSNGNFGVSIGLNF